MTADKQIELERDLSAAHRRIREMILEIDRRDEMISNLQRRVAELEQALIIAQEAQCADN